MSCLSARLKPECRDRAKVDLLRLGLPNRKNMVFSIRATEIFNPLEYKRLEMLQGDPRWNEWTIAGSGFSPNPTIVRWRAGYSVRLEVHYVLSLVLLEITGWRMTVDEMTDGSLAQIIAFQERHTNVQNLLSQLHSFRSRSPAGSLLH